jgi:hypothetical protein
MEIMMLNPWFFGLETVQQGWQAQSAMAFSLMRSFAGGVPDRTTSSPMIPDTVAVDIKAQEEAFAATADVREAPAAIADEQEAPVAIADVREAPAAITDEQEAPVAIADVRRRKALKVLRVSKGTSRVKARSVSKRAAAASQNSKAVRRSARKPR